MLSKLLEILVRFISSLLKSKTRVETTPPEVKPVEVAQMSQPKPPVEVSAGVDPHKYFSRTEYLKGRDVEYPLDATLEANMKNLLIAITPIREAWKNPIGVNSGYRPGRYNEAAGGSKKSSHLTCEAIDLHDREGKLAKFIIDGGWLEKCDLYMEDPKATPGWVHLQTRKTSSGIRVFRP